MITNIVMCLITLSALTACIVLVLKNYDLKSQSEEAMAQLKSFEEESEHYIYTQADLDSYLEEARADAQEAGENEILSELKSRMDGGSNTAAVLRDFFPEDVVVYADGSYQFAFADFKECGNKSDVINIWTAKQEDAGVQRICISYEPSSESGEYFPHTVYEFIYLYSNVKINGEYVPQMNYRFETRVENPEGTVTELIGDWGGEHEWTTEF